MVIWCCRVFKVYEIALTEIDLEGRVQVSCSMVHNKSALLYAATICSMKVAATHGRYVYT